MFSEVLNLFVLVLHCIFFGSLVWPSKDTRKE